MTDVTQQLADALREAEDALAWCYNVQLAPGEKTSPQHKALTKVREALTAFEASRAALDDVDGVLVHARNVVDGRDICEGCAGTWTLEELRARPGTISCCPERKMRPPTFAETLFARAALSAMPRDEELEALLAKALRRLAFWAQTSGGTAGRDDGLVAAIDVGLAALRQYDTKLAQEPRS